MAMATLIAPDGTETEMPIPNADQIRSLLGCVKFHSLPLPNGTMYVIADEVVVEK